MQYCTRTVLQNFDGLFIHPIIGRKKIGDFTQQALIKGYEILISEFYPKNRVLLGTLNTSGRYAGPREASLGPAYRPLVFNVPNKTLFFG